MSEAEVAASPLAETRIHWETMENMMMLGETRFYLDISDMNLYPPTKKLWYQLQAYPHETVPVLDQGLKDCLMEIAAAEDQRNRTTQSSIGNQASQQTLQSSEPVFPSSDAPDGPETPATPRPRAQIVSLEDEISNNVYFVRPFGLPKTTNMRDLNPSGKNLPHMKPFVLFS